MNSTSGVKADGEPSDSVPSTDDKNDIDDISSLRDVLSFGRSFDCEPHFGRSSIVRADGFRAGKLTLLEISEGLIDFRFTSISVEQVADIGSAHAIWAYPQASEYLVRQAVAR